MSPRHCKLSLTLKAKFGQAIKPNDDVVETISLPGKAGTWSLSTATGLIQVALKYHQDSLFQKHNQLSLLQYYFYWYDLNIVDRLDPRQTGHAKIPRNNQ